MPARRLQSTQPSTHDNRCVACTRRAHAGRRGDPNAQSDGADLHLGRRATTGSGVSAASATPHRRCARERGPRVAGPLLCELSKAMVARCESGDGQPPPTNAGLLHHGLGQVRGRRPGRHRPPRAHHGGNARGDLGTIVRVNNVPQGGGARGSISSRRRLAHGSPKATKAARNSHGPGRMLARQGRVSLRWCDLHQNGCAARQSWGLGWPSRGRSWASLGECSVRSAFAVGPHSALPATISARTPILQVPSRAGRKQLTPEVAAFEVLRKRDRNQNHPH